MNPTSPYLQQRANTWVSVAVLTGGLASAIILFFLMRVQNDRVASTLTAQEQYFYYLDESGG